MAASNPKGLLAGKTVLLTGAAGNIGSQISRDFVNAGATLIMSGRTKKRIEDARMALLKETGAPENQVMTVTMDGGDPSSVRDAVTALGKSVSHIDVLINNAGSAGPKQPLFNIPFSKDEMDALGEGETVGDAIRNILGVTWNVTRLFAPMMKSGGSVINVSTIFSLTRYYGRVAYVVPKAALNALSDVLAEELGPKGIRVNTVFPGPIESDRIRTVFAAMDKVQGNEDGFTADYFTGRMSLNRDAGTSKKDKSLPTPFDVSGACQFLASDSSQALNGVDIDVTNGMSARRDRRSTYLTRPNMRSLDGAGLSIIVVAGEQWEDALEIARVQMDAGAKVLLGLARNADVAQAEARVKAQELTEGLTIVRFARSEPETMEKALADYSAEQGAINSAIIQPLKPAGYFSGPVSKADDEAVEEFMDREVMGAMAIGRTLARYWRERDDLIQTPRFVFLSPKSDGAGNAWARIASDGISQLVNIWRDESRVQATKGDITQPAWGNQIIRYTNEEAENAPFTAGHASGIACYEKEIAELSLYLPKNIAVETGARSGMLGFAENITGLHKGKVAFVTGGSAGIGGQVARLLALAGAKVMMVARRESALEAARDRIVGELQDIGFSGVDRRVKIMPNIDVSDFESLRGAIHKTIQIFGRIDYLINNAGVAGAEDMVVDMTPEDWQFTLDANLNSNYLLTHEVVPLMRAQGSGYVLNVSSYFGGEKLLAVAYPNRADYAVSKAGQRSMVENFSRALGPEIQCNAIAPGPVDGDRLSGTGGKPGLFQRRARLILENKRLNAVYEAVIKSVRKGADVAHTLSRLAHNTISTLSHDAHAPDPLRALALELARQGDGVCTWDQYMLTETIAASLLKRLGLGGYLLDAPDWQSKLDGKDTAGKWLRLVPPDDSPFLPQSQIASTADKVGRGVRSQLHLGKMPTEEDVAQATVFYLADRAVSGETFMPSGGLRVERSYTEREMFGSPKQERLDKMKGKTVWIIGEHLSDYLSAASTHLVQEIEVGRVVIMTETKKGAADIKAKLNKATLSKCEIIITKGDIEGEMDKALSAWGRPTTVVSTPFAALPGKLFDADAPLTPDEFRTVVEQNLTHHFRVSRKASLYDRSQLVLVSPDVPLGSPAPAFSLANFIKTTLHAFTATLAVENERLVHDVATNQINLTRRVRSEEPRNEEEMQEELSRFTRAILLVGAPLPDAQDSRYRAKIYRGTSMTV